MSKTLGLDMSSNKSGYALFDDKNLITYGLWEPKDKMEWRDRVIYMGEQLDDFLKHNEVNQVYCEDVPLMMKNPQTLKMLSALQGVLMGVCVANNVKVTFISVSTWRSALGLFDKTQKGKERDEMKQKSIEMANRIFGLDLVYKSPSSRFNQDDEADSILVAYSQILYK
jgi:Holliday junction resolvasome RuvABC endonuclease subunit